MIISIVVGPRFIAFLRRNEFGQPIREEGPEHHVVKQGTPVMGGLLIMIAMTVGFMAMSKYTLPALTVFGVTLACAGIGFLDDFIKLTHRRSLGLSGRWKLLLLAGITVGIGFAAHNEHFATSVYIPILNVRPSLWWFWYVLIFLMLAGAANGVNLTDGIDGLAAGTGIIALVSFTAINVLAYIRTGSGDPNALDLAILGGALAGAAIGFLWFNAFPAEVFLGDTGSMGIGGALGAFAIFAKTEVGRLAEAGVEVRLGTEVEELLEHVDVVVKSPGVPADAPPVRAAREQGVPVWSEIELGYRLLPGNPFIGVTGTKGKTTTVRVLGAMFAAAGRPAHLAGNEHQPLSEAAG